MTSVTHPNLLVRATSETAGRIVDITPESAGWRHVGFQVFRLARGQRVQGQMVGEEGCLVMLSGHIRARAGERDWADIGGRASPFDGPPHALYLPIGADYLLEALDDRVEFAIGTGPVDARTQQRSPRLIAPDQVRVSTRGSGDMERTIHDILMDNEPAETLLVTEVLTPGGHWSSYPPHKHDTYDPPRETYLEELYYHRLRRPDGWAVQRVYTRDRSLDVTLAVRDGDCVLVPRGYHPVSAAPGFDLYYLNIMAGPVRQWRVTFDSDVERALDAR
jgi:5-deoxy-glucuronate isomerase